jgi:glycosyltransferase involved in cell wall biosynthesis
MLLESWAPEKQPRRVGEWWRSRAWSAIRWHDPWARDLYRRRIDQLQPDVIHVRHLLAHSLDLIDVCTELGVPVVVSLHDFYPLCPGIHLLDATGTYCAGRCPETGSRCQVPIHWLENLPIGEPGFITEWRRHMGEALARAAHLVTTSSSTLELYHEHLPMLQSLPTSIIEHGRDIPRRSLAPEPPAEGQAIRILLPAVSGPHKGSAFVRALAEHDRRSTNRLELHTIGATDPTLRGLTIDHGPYDREDLPDHIAAIRPHVVGIFSTWPETYSHVLTEAWSQGIPVFVSPLGALAERVTRHGAGWLLPIDNPVHAHATILGIAADPDAYLGAALDAERTPMPTTIEMARRYVAVYEQVMDRATRSIG